VLDCDVCIGYEICGNFLGGGWNLMDEMLVRIWMHWLMLVKGGEDV
jgi:hypothetical protein